DHADRAVRARQRAQAAADAAILVDHDLAAARIALDRVVLARRQTARVAAGPAGVDEVEHAELVAAEGQPLRAMAVLARLLALLAVDAQVELADPHRRARDRQAVADIEVEDLVLDAGDRAQPRPGRSERRGDRLLDARRDAGQPRDRV